MTQEVPNAYLTGLPRYWVSTQVVSTQTEIRMGTDPIRTYLRIFGLDTALDGTSLVLACAK